MQTDFCNSPSFVVYCQNIVIFYVSVDSCLAGWSTPTRLAIVHWIRCIKAIKATCFQKIFRFKHIP